MAGLELHKHVNVALRSKVVSQDRSEEGETADVMLAAKIGYFIRVDGYAGHLS